MSPRRSAWWRRLATIALGLGTGLALAQTYPAREVRLVVPYSAGGSSDVVARVIGGELQRLWNKPVVVENKAGASGNIGSMEVVRAAPDGYTLLVQNDTMLTNLALQGKLPYDHQSDLTPILLVGVTPLMIVAHPASGITDVASLVAASRQHAGGLSYGSCGVGSPAHFVMELFRQKTRIELQQIGYRGCAPAVVDVVSGQIPVAAVSANLVLAHVKSGRLRAVGVSSAQRYAALPDVPTLAEQGLQPFDLSTWKALMGPARLPDAVVQKIGQDVGHLLKTPGVIATLEQAGVDIQTGDAAALARVIEADATRYRELAAAANLRPN